MRELGAACAPRPALALLVALALVLFGAGGAYAQDDPIFADDLETGGPWLWSFAETDRVDYLHPKLVDQALFYDGTPAECATGPATPDFEGAFEPLDPAGVPPGTAVVLYVNAHIEKSTPYANPIVFAQGVAELEAMAAVFQAHGARLTVNVQDPFVDVVQSTNDPILHDLVAAGHELAIHFHEDEQLGADADSLAPAVWAARLAELKAQIEAESGGVAIVRGMSGGNSYAQLLEAMQLVGLDTKFNYKDPPTQLSVAPAVTVMPYFPGAWGSEEAMLRGGGEHVVFLPAGVYPLHCTTAGGINDPVRPRPFDRVTRALAASLDSAVPGEVQVQGLVFSLNRIDPATFDEQIGLWDRWFEEVLDPLAAAGVLYFSTASPIVDEVAARAGRELR